MSTHSPFSARAALSRKASFGALALFPVTALAVVTLGVVILVGCARDDSSESAAQQAATDGYSVEILHDTWVKDSATLQGSAPRAGSMCFVPSGLRFTARGQGAPQLGHRALTGLASEGSLGQSTPLESPAPLDGGFLTEGEQAENAASFPQDFGPSVAPASDSQQPSRDLWCLPDFFLSRSSSTVFLYAPHVRVTRLGDAGSSSYGVAKKFSWPVPLGTVLSSGYGRRGGRMHSGLDLAANKGTPIFAAGTGRVIGRRSGSTTGPDSGALWRMPGTVAQNFGFGHYGNVVLLSHGAGAEGVDLYTLYAHNTRVTVAEGDEVREGDMIAEMGSTGRSTGPHLHYEVWRGGWQNRPNPMNYTEKKRAQ